MRNCIVHPGADELTYEIREIVAVGEELAKMGVPIYWENIGDPIAKGCRVPEWIKDIVADLVTKDDTSYGYSPTRGVLHTRQYLADKRNAEGGAHITPDDILFFNGLGDAIQTSFFYLHPRSRVLGPNPAYPTYSSAEGAHADARHLTYRLQPEKGWQPDLVDIENKVKYNPEISGILIINPDNPTGVVYSRATLEGIIDIARRYDLFVMSDEIYANIVYGGTMVPLSQVIGTVPGIAFKGLSKEVPWPGARCGWIEVYNREVDDTFRRYVKSLVDAKMLEVCSTTLPQKALPRIMSDARYQVHLDAVAQGFGEKATHFEHAFRDLSQIIVNKPQGAFYASVVFKDGVLNSTQTLPIRDARVRSRVEQLTTAVPLDKRFTYYLMAATGVTVVPLSGMNSDLFGFRLTLLEPDQGRFNGMLETVHDAIIQYCSST